MDLEDYEFGEEPLDYQEPIINPLGKPLGKFNYWVKYSKPKYESLIIPSQKDYEVVKPEDSKKEYEALIPKDCKNLMIKIMS